LIKKLRVRFICVTMLIVTVVIVVALGILTEYMQKSLVKDQYAMLHRIAEDPGMKVRPSITTSKNFHLPCFILEYTTDGRLDARGDSSFDLTNEAEPKELYELGCGAEETEGVLEDRGLRYVRMETPRGRKLVFGDMSAERATMRYLIRESILIGLGVFSGVLIITLFASARIVEPVEDAWKQQKQFVSDVSHELKTPLTVIIANAELLEQPGYGEEKRREFGSNILCMSRQMRRLVESLLDLARLDSLREADTHKENVDLSAVTEDCVLPFEPLYFERGLTLESDIEPDIRVYGNEQALRRCVDILLDNAQKYSDPGTVRLRLQKSGRNAELTVRNPSPELTRTECRDIFKRFYRRDAARTNSGSYGLGLPIAEGIVERHNGEIECGWADGEICFTVKIPLM
jgi:signal transduction histidine kinase